MYPNPKERAIEHEQEWRQSALLAWFSEPVPSAFGRLESRETATSD